MTKIINLYEENNFKANKNENKSDNYSKPETFFHVGYINYNLMHDLGINDLNLYALAEIVAKLSAKSKGGWCYASKETLAKQFLTNRQQIHRRINRLEADGIIERNQQGKLRPGERWLIEATKYDSNGGLKTESNQPEPAKEVSPEPATNQRENQIQSYEARAEAVNSFTIEESVQFAERLIESCFADELPEETPTEVKPIPTQRHQHVYDGSDIMSITDRAEQDKVYWQKCRALCILVAETNGFWLNSQMSNLQEIKGKGNQIIWAWAQDKACEVFKDHNHIRNSVKKALMYEYNKVTLYANRNKGNNTANSPYKRIVI